MSLTSLTAVELGKKIKAKEVTVKEALEAVFAQIDKSEETINSYVNLYREEAFQKAEEVQKKIDAGELTGPLAGVPVAIKDNICTKGMTTTCSSKILYNFVPTYTAQAVENLEAAGAVIIGKTNMDEFAMGSTTETSAFGATKKSVEYGTRTGGIFRRFLCSRCRGGMLLCIGFRHRRFHPSAKLFLRSDRIKANLRNRIPLRINCLWFFVGSDWPNRKRCDRLCYDFEDHYFL